MGEPTVNRKYGIALELRAPPERQVASEQDLHWQVQQVGRPLPPLKSSRMWSMKLGLLIKGTELNHPSGAMLDVKDDSTAVDTLITFVKNTSSGLVVEMAMSTQLAKGGMKMPPFVKSQMNGTVVQTKSTSLS